MPKATQVLVRMRPVTKAALEQAAKEQDRSTTAEIVSRLEASLSRDERFGGPGMTKMVYLMAASFGLGVQRNGRGTEDWRTDPDRYGAGMISVVDALLRQFPGSPEQAEPILQAIVGRFKTWQLMERHK